MAKTDKIKTKTNKNNGKNNNRKTAGSSNPSVSSVLRAVKEGRISPTNAAAMLTLRS
tara:strand:- start:780 stop:950 length:171 start_codon:yes stop_codon:yes gene_type:complete